MLAQNDRIKHGFGRKPHQPFKQQKSRSLAEILSEFWNKRRSPSTGLLNSYAAYAEQER
jgi:hypothetical protein